MPTTLAEIVTEINVRFPRSVTANTTTLTNSMLDMLREVCGRYPFWFLRIDPGFYLPTQFQMTETELQGLTHYQTNWVDRGWLHLPSGTDRVILAAPSLQGQYDQTSNQWKPVKASRMNYVNQYNLNGSFVQSMYVEPGSSFYCRSDWSSTGQPTHCFLETGLDGSGNECSWLRFSPIPNDDYLFAVSFYVSEPIPTASDSSQTNRLFQEYPEVAITVGLLCTAEYFAEAQYIEYYRKRLWGDPPRGGYGKLSAYAGLIGNMIRDSKRKREQDDQTIPQYLGARGAVGRTGSGIGRNRYRGVYTGKWGFS